MNRQTKNIITNIETVLIFLLLTFVFMQSETAFAQNGINTPYSRYGFGIQADRANGFNKGMAGVAQGFRDRQTIIDLFTEFPGAGALFMNPQAAGVGLNITAANHVIHFNPEWNPALTSQATARAFRRKQTLPVTVHHLFYEGTVEEDALLRADWKRALAQRVDDGAATTKEGPET